MRSTAFLCLALVVFLLPCLSAVEADGHQRITARAGTTLAPNRFKAAIAATPSPGADLTETSGPPTRVYVIVFFKTFFATLAFAGVLALLGYGLYLCVRRFMEWRRGESSVEYVSLIIAG